jgi:glucose/arabinose dehydrogenase
MRALAATVVLTALLATACGDDDGSDNDAVRPSTPPPTATTTTTAPPPETTTTTLPAPPDLASVRVALEEVASGLRSPVAITWRPGDERMYVSEQHTGRVRIVAGGAVLPEPVLELPVSSGNEQGLLGLAFSADGDRLYVHSTDPGGDSHVDEYTMRGDTADPGSRRELLFVRQPFRNHNGGHVVFGPDGMLYVGLGDGGSAGDPEGNAQDLGTVLGAILRIDPTATGDAPYAVPADNPFLATPGARPEIWMYGLRNPWRFSFDRATGDVWIADVGQNAWEEVNVALAGDAAGANWGWNLREGTHEFRGSPPPGAREPILDRSHGEGNCSITGGYVYRGPTIPALVGAYVFVDYCRGELTAVTQRDGALVDARELGVEIPDVTTFGEDPTGELYVVTRPGRILRIVSG